MNCFELMFGPQGGAAEIRCRAGGPQDLATLREIDDDAGALFETAGLFLDLPEGHEYHLAERRRWARSLARGATTIATDSNSHALGFIALDEVDGDPFVAQLSVRVAHMRRGIGTMLLHAAVGRVAAGGSLWLTTYAHLPWNQPFYQRCGFGVVEEWQCGTELREQLRFERRWLPRPEQRVAMRQYAPER